MRSPQRKLTLFLLTFVFYIHGFAGEQCQWPSGLLQKVFDTVTTREDRLFPDFELDHPPSKENKLVEEFFLGELFSLLLKNSNQFPYYEDEAFENLRETWIRNGSFPLLHETSSGSIASFIQGRSYTTLANAIDRGIPLWSGEFMVGSLILTREATNRISTSPFIESHMQKHVRGEEDGTQTGYYRYGYSLYSFRVTRTLGKLIQENKLKQYINSLKQNIRTAKRGLNIPIYAWSQEEYLFHLSLLNTNAMNIEKQLAKIVSNPDVFSLISNPFPVHVLFLAKPGMIISRVPPNEMAIRSDISSDGILCFVVPTSKTDLVEQLFQQHNLPAQVISFHQYFAILDSYLNLFMFD